MRCRKVRSCLSAYCKDELAGRKKLAVGEHLAVCTDCRAVKAEYHSLGEIGNQIPGMSVSDGFNTALLNQIAQERFAETRTKAYLPKPVPVIRWAAVVPSVVGAFVVIFVAAMSFMPGSLDDNMGMATTHTVINDAYLTAQPIRNPNMTQPIAKDWSLTSQLARTEKLRERTQRVINRMRINATAPQYRVSNVSHNTDVAGPYVPTYYRLRQNVKTYQSPEPQRGATTVY